MDFSRQVLLPTATILLVAVVLGMLMTVGGCAKAVPVQWEYKAVTLKPSGGADDKSPTQTTPLAADLNQLGAEGWELVSSYSEVETTFPNFGSADYHTGIKQNVRTHQAVLIFKRKATR